MNLTTTQQEIHNCALDLARQHRIVEAKLIEILQRIERFKIHKKLGMRSLFQYATESLRLDENVAYALINVARKSVTFPALQAAIVEKTLTVSKANRIVANLNHENAVELIEFAKTHSKNDIELEMAKRNPRSAAPDRMKPLSKDLVEMKVAISKETFEKLKRVESLLAQKNKDFAFDPLLNEVFGEWLEKNDPVKKAERAQARLLAPKPRAIEKKPHPIEKPNPKTTKRVPLTAAQVHAVFARDQGKCTTLLKFQKAELTNLRISRLFARFTMTWFIR